MAGVTGVPAGCAVAAAGRSMLTAKAATPTADASRARRCGPNVFMLSILKHFRSALLLAAGEVAIRLCLEGRPAGRAPGHRSPAGRPGQWRAQPRPVDVYRTLIVRALL